MEKKRKLIAVAREEMALYTYQDIEDFQKKHPGKEEREQILKSLTEEEIMHLARTCGNVTTAACFMQFARNARKVDDRSEESKNIQE